MTTPAQAWMRDIGGREEALTIARTHVYAETTTDTDTICATISRDVFFAVPVRTREGNEIPVDAVLDGYEQVRDYYSGRAGSYVVLASSQIKNFATDWYVFNESAATLRGTGDIGGIDARGREFVVNSVIIFPTAPDGIRGEICVTRYPFEDIVAGTVQAPPPAPALRGREMENGALLERLVDALALGDLAGVGALLTDRSKLAVRLDDRDGNNAIHTATDRADAQAVFGKLFAGARDIALTARAVTEWYVFAEFLLRLEGGGIRRLAATLPVDDGRIGGAFGYGRDEAQRPRAPDA